MNDTDCQYSHWQGIATPDETRFTHESMRIRPAGEALRPWRSDMQLPPYACSDLRRPWLRREVDRRGVTGAMAAHVGAQHDVAALASTASFQFVSGPGLESPRALTCTQRASLARVRAFSVPALVGREVVAAGDTALPAALSRALDAWLPGIAWQAGDDVLWGIRKYLLCLTAIAAPVDRTTASAMALQLYGPIVAIEGASLDAARERIGERMLRGEPLAAIDRPFTVRIEVATYANVQAPDVGVPFCG
jgi:hypothetical protein